MDVYLIDGTYELFRHYYAMPSAKDAGGIEIRAGGVSDASVVLALLDGAVRWLVPQRLAAERGACYPSWISPGVEPRPSRLAWCYGDPGIAAVSSMGSLGFLAGPPVFGYYAPELHEMHVRVPLQIRSIGGEEKFRPTGVFINDQAVRYAYWYFDGSTHDYADIPNASRKKVEVFAAKLDVDRV